MIKKLNAEFFKNGETGIFISRQHKLTKLPEKDVYIHIVELCWPVYALGDSGYH